MQKLIQNSHNDYRAHLTRLFLLCYSQKVRANNSSFQPTSRFTFSQTRRHGVKETHLNSLFSKGQTFPAVTAVLHWYAALSLAESQAVSNSPWPPTRIPTQRRENTEKPMGNGEQNLSLNLIWKPIKTLNGPTEVTHAIDWGKQATFLFSTYFFLKTFPFKYNNHHLNAKWPIFGF